MLNLDKFWHYQVGLLVALAVGHFLSKQLAIIVVMGIGLAKELYDSYHPDKHTADGQDFIATVVGGLTGVALL